MIPLRKVSFVPEVYENVKRVLESGWPGMGPETAKFEEEFAQWLGTKYAIAMNSGTEALRIAIASAEYRPGSYILSTPNTFVSTNHVILQAGHEVIFADINPNTGSIDPCSVERILKWNLSKRPVAIMVVHYAGIPADYSALYDLAFDYEVDIIEDCAHACGSRIKNGRVGSTAEYACFSFHAVKNLAIGDGGMLVTCNEEIAEKARKFRWLGIDKSTYERSKGYYSWEYDVPYLGYKSHMNDIMAAIGRAQLKDVDAHNIELQRVADTYIGRLNSLSKVKLLRISCQDTSSNHLFVVRFKNSQLRQRIMEEFIKHDIAYGYHYKPNYLYPIYRNCLGDRTLGMEEFYRTALSLPIYRDLTYNQIQDICDIIMDIATEE